ncbi:hypothetical protein IAU59_005426 [Kwoniella sp. CBS 9459]
MPPPHDYDNGDEGDEEHSEEYDDEDCDGYSYGDGPPETEEDSGSDASTDDEFEVGESTGPLFDLGETLAQAIRGVGDFSFGGAADFLPAVPTLLVEGYGDVTLPLVDSTQAEELIRVCERAPFGRGDETLTDTSIRNSWQLDPSKLEITDPEWSAGIQRAQSIIAAKLGVADVPITLELYKMLLYKTGGHFAKHRDIEKADRMFATMVVQLPSCHQGGRLMVYKDSETDAIAHDFGHTAGTAPSMCHYAVHYADAEHAVEPITEGYRVALVYSICWPAQSPRTMPTAPPSTREIMARHLVSLANDNRHFHYFLSHAYTPKSIAELGSRALKCEDRARLANLWSANDTVDKAYQYVFYLGKAERTSWYGGGGGASGYDNCDWDLSGSSKSIVELYGLDGKSLSERTIERPLNEKDTLNPDRLTATGLWKGHRTTTYEGDLGNEGPTKDTTYHKYIFLALPPRSLWTDLAQYVGDEAAFYALKQSGVSQDALRTFLGCLTKKDADKSADRRSSALPTVYSYSIDARGYTPSQPLDNNSFRHSVFEEILKMPRGPDRGALAQLYVIAFPSCVNMASASEPVGKWADMLQLINNDDLWQAVRSTIVGKLQGELGHVHRFVLQCFSSGIPLAEWQDVLAIATQPRTQLPSDTGLASELSQQDTWKSALFIQDVEFCRVIVDQYVQIDPSKLHKAVAVILDLYKHSRQFFSPEKRTLLSPLLHRRIAYNVEAQKKIARANAAGMWVFPDAIFTPRPEVQRFFRSRDRTMTLYGFDGIGHARNFCNKYQKEGLNASYTLSPGGIGKKAFVEITKTEGESNKRKRMSEILKEELPLLKAICPEGADDTLATPATSAASPTRAPAAGSKSGQRKSGAHEADNNSDDDVVFTASKKARVK